MRQIMMRKLMPIDEVEDKKVCLVVDEVQIEVSVATFSVLFFA
jgi:hypothetical protein